MEEGLKALQGVADQWILDKLYLVISEYRKYYSRDIDKMAENIELLQRRVEKLEEK